MQRRVATLAMAAAGLAVSSMLTACEKPLPAATFFSGSHSTRIEASCWTEDEQGGDCAIPQTGSGELEVSPGDTVGISVDPEVAEHGWVPAIGNSSLVPRAIKEKYYKLTLNEEQIQQGSLQVFATEDGSSFRGVWVIDVRRT